MRGAGFRYCNIQEGTRPPVPAVKNRKVHTDQTVREEKGGKGREGEGRSFFFFSAVCACTRREKKLFPG